MSTYIDSGPNQRDHSPGYSWNTDLRERLTWLYGNADLRQHYQREDIAKWRNLGKQRTA